FSNHYIKLKTLRKELYRKQAEIRKQDHYVLINKLLNLGDKFYVETMSYKRLQTRAKDTTINEKTGRINKKKRFGKSLANKAPSMFLNMLDNKLKWSGEKLYKIDTAKCRASQYNHFSDEYNKKELKDRWNNGMDIQRDCYSAFLIMNVNEDLKSI
ncbi:transposase, partial [Clostridioides sp. ZZV14-5902]|nr:transposase [Clostridioides sp. ZZV14-5902]